MRANPRTALLAAITLAAAQSTAVASSRQQRGDWIEAKSAHYSVFFRAGFEKDAEFARTWADRTEALMKSKYGVTPVHYRMSIYLHPAPAPNADLGNAHNHCCSAGTDGVSTGTIDMLAPSAPQWATFDEKSSLGMPKNNEDYHAKILMSEYIPIGHYETQRTRAAGGWEYYSAPNWLVQGLQEYDAIFHTTETNRAVTSRHLVDWAVAHPATVTCCDQGLKITDDYNGGAIFMTFLAAEFGEDVHARLLRSPAATFDEALSEVTKPYSRQELFDRFARWRIATAAAK